MKRCLVITTIICTWTLSANAAVRSGDLDLDFGLSWTSEDGAGGAGDRDVIDLSAGVDYFVTNRISLGLSMGYYDKEQNSSAAYAEQTEKTWSFRVKYHLFKHNRLVPYIGYAWKYYETETKTGSIALPVTTKKDDNGSALLLGGRYELTRHNDVYAELQLNDYGSNWPTSTDGGIKFIIGLIHQLN